MLREQNGLVFCRALDERVWLNTKNSRADLKRKEKTKMAEQDYLRLFLEEKTKTFQEELEKQVAQKVVEVEQSMRDKLSEIERLLTEARQIKLPPKVKIEESGMEEMAHNQLQDLVDILGACSRNKKTVMLVGAAGAGKSKMVSQCARVFGKEFYPMSIGAQTTKSDLMGFMNAQGEYVTTPVRMAFENGGILLLDEIDAGNSGTLTILNNLLSNNEIMFPDKKVAKHPDFQCVCTANTYGRGGTLEYVGRNRLDAATLDRFVIFNVHYDLDLEKYLCKNDWYHNVIQQMRNNAEKYDIKIIISPRACIDGADLLDAGFKVKEVLDMVVFKGVSDDVRSKILEGIDLKMPKKK